MTPLAAKVANQLTLPLAKRTFDDQAGVLALFDQEMHCFEVSAISKSVNQVLDDPLEDNDVDEAWSIWRDIETMLPRMFLPSPVTWLEQIFNGHRIACVLQEKEGVFSLITVHDGPRGGCSVDMCKFRARGVLEAGEDRIEVFDLAEQDDEDEPDTLDLPKVFKGIDPKTATPEQRAQMTAAHEIASLRVDALNRKADRLNAAIDFLGAAHRFIGMMVLTLDLINTPGLIGLRQRQANKRLARDLNRIGVGRYPLLAWSEVVLKHQTQFARPEERQTGVTYHKCLHFVRSHLRHYRDGRVTVIPAHWRGDPALGIKRTRYRLAA